MHVLDRAHDERGAHMYGDGAVTEPWKRGVVLGVARQLVYLLPDR
jgi:hypothetical protein